MRCGVTAIIMLSSYTNEIAYFGSLKGNELKTDYFPIKINGFTSKFNGQVRQHLKCAQTYYFSQDFYSTLVH